MKTTLGTRLILSYLIVILVGMGLAVPPAWLAVERLYLNQQGASLLAQAQLVAAALGSETAPASAPTSAVVPQPYSQASNAMPGIHTRLIDAQGAVVIDLGAGSGPGGTTSLALPQLAQNEAGQVTSAELLSRPEISQALQGQPATAIRSVAAAGGKRVLYAAAPVYSNGSLVQIVYLATPLPDTGLGAFLAAARGQFAAVFLAAVVLSGAAGLLLGQRIARPLAQLAGAARAVASGDLNQSAPEDGSIRELTVLGQAFNRMTASLRQADQAKTAFISDVTHELRTPLTVIKGTIETLEDGAIDDQQVRGPFLAAMNRETERLIRLVNDLLVLTRADAGALNLHLQPLDLAELGRARRANFEPAAKGSCVSLVVRPPVGGPEDYRVMGDADRLAQVFDNLLDNALRYAPPGSQVSVTCEREGSRVVCTISDSGPGIPAQHLPLIFERFYRADPARDHGRGGSGLGLAIVRSLLQAHGGNIDASSGEGQGAAFTFWLPAATG